MIVGVTPARGGSKGIRRKNIQLLCGKPLIGWTIESAQQSTLLDRYVISTEDPEVSEISHSFGAEVIRRPIELASDDILIVYVLQDLLTHIEADTIVLLQCTSPIRNPDLIDNCIRKFEESEADCLATGYMCKIFELGSFYGRRQDFNPFFRADGSVFVIKADNIRKGDLFGGKREMVINERESTFDIDEEFDLWINEQILMKRSNLTPNIKTGLSRMMHQTQQNLKKRQNSSANIISKINLIKKACSK